MDWKVITAGKPSQSYARDAVALYHERMKRFAPVELQYLKVATPAEYERAAGSSLRVILDETGKQMSTRRLAETVSNWEMDRVKSVSVWIGGADGFSPEIRKGADLVLSLSACTLMHELALVVWMEQLYRVYTVNAGHPYHRD